MISQNLSKYLFLVALSAAVTTLSIWTFRHQASRETPAREELSRDSSVKPTNVVGSEVTSATIDLMPNVHAWRSMSREEKLATMEKLGKVPDFADITDAQLAERTSWWGRKIDSRTFWVTNIVWLDSNAVSRANQFGRRFPPIPAALEGPYESLKDVDVRREHASWHVDGGAVNYRYSYREQSFWDSFFKSNPKPIPDLERAQERAADTFVSAQSPRPKSMFRNREPKEIVAGIVHQNKPFNFPPELFEPEALRWTYILMRRREYSDFVERWGVDSPNVRSLLDRLGVDSTLVTGPWLPEHEVASKQWKVNYLKRLVAEGVDYSYINYYSAGWGIPLSEAK